MARAVDSVDPGTSSSSDRTAIGKARLAVFTLAALAVVALNVVLTPPEVLLAAFVGWGGEFGVHSVHDMTISVAILLALIVPMALMLYHPKARVNTIIAPLVAIPIAIMAFEAGSELFPGFAIMSVLAVVAFALHPAGRSLVELDRVETIDRRLAGLFALGAIPLLAYGLLEFGKQFGTTVDDHVLFVHYGAMGLAAVLVGLMGTLAIVRERDWRFATWFAGLTAAAIGLFSIGFPNVPSSLGLLGGLALFVWAGAFVAGSAYVRRGGAGIDDIVDERSARPA